MLCLVSSACRYGFMMCLGSVILKVESACVADQMWYFPLLRPYYDHVPVKPDLSDLVTQIQWCKDNDDKCQVIAQNAKLVYDKYISKEGIMDYMQVIYHFPLLNIFIIHINVELVTVHLRF